MAACNGQARFSPQSRLSLKGTYQAEKLITAKQIIAIGISGSFKVSGDFMEHFNILTRRLTTSAAGPKIPDN
jgi:hypothetical protein